MIDKEYYVFLPNQKQMALEAQNVISQLGQCPIVGTNRGTGELDPSALTVKWARIRERLDGCWVFTRVPKAKRDEYPQGVHATFMLNFPHTIETETPTWFPLATIPV